ncbi:short-chain fatty acyl-CoA regulator family protein, partial [Streptomyces sp. NPDC056081]|uniref:short-chain fatty acyl-CoA regulator family protein n=1 Tax=Streptomyces sp. NPDC056081 TaxID=3345705 RepID=UPI0035D5F09A
GEGVKRPTRARQTATTLQRIAEVFGIGTKSSSEAAEGRLAATPIGLGCRIRERRDCARRARPPAGGRLSIDPDRRSRMPYPVEGTGP